MQRCANRRNISTQSFKRSALLLLKWLTFKKAVKICLKEFCRSEESLVLKIKSISLQMKWSQLMCLVRMLQIRNFSRWLQMSSRLMNAFRWFQLEIFTTSHLLNVEKFTRIKASLTISTTQRLLQWQRLHFLASELADLKILNATRQLLLVLSMTKR